MSLKEIIIIILLIPVGLWLLGIAYKAPYGNNSLTDGIGDLIDRIDNYIYKAKTKNKNRKYDKNNSSRKS